jgi:hypothetical protein
MIFFGLIFVKKKQKNICPILWVDLNYSGANKKNYQFQMDDEKSASDTK